MSLNLSSLEPEVPPNAELSLEVELLEATDAPDLELLPPAEKIALASLKRERGNVHYQRGDYAFAVNSYSIALQITESSSKGEMQARESGLGERFITVSFLSALGLGASNGWGSTALKELMLTLIMLFW